MDGNGVEDLAVGAYYAGTYDKGELWILFLNSDGTVDSEVRIAEGSGGFSGTLTNEARFGTSVSNIGDLDDDDITDLIVGAHSESDGGYRLGSVWILFMKSDGTVKSEQKISNSSEGFSNILEAEDYFGTAVESIGDLDNNEIVDIAVGADGDDDGDIRAGAIYILNLDIQIERTISYNNNEGTGTIADQKGNDGETLTLSDGSGFSKTNYTFNNWNTEADGTGNSYSAEEAHTLEQDITLYAQWNPTSYSINYHLNNGSNGSNPSIYNIESNDITLEDATKTGYTFEGWYSESEFSNEVESINTGSTGNLDLYAKWSLVTYNITYHLNGGINGSNPETYNIETSTLSLEDASKASYSFGGWYTEAEYSNEISQIETGKSGNLALYAKFTPIDYKISYHLDSGSNGLNPTTYNIESSTITLQNPTKTGFNFIGWYTESEFLNSITHITTGTSGNLDIYAKWELIIVTTTTTTTTTSTSTSSSTIPKPMISTTTIPISISNTTTTSSTSTPTTTLLTTTTTKELKKLPENSNSTIVITENNSEIEIEPQNLTNQDEIKIQLPIEVIAKNQELDPEKVDHVKITLEEKEYTFTLSEDKSCYETTIKLPEVKGLYTLAIEVSYNGEIIYQETQGLNIKTSTTQNVFNFIKSYWYIFTGLIVASYIFWIMFKANYE